MKIRQTVQVLVFALALGNTARAQVTLRMSVAAGGAEGNQNSSYSTISADGLSVAFRTEASNLIPGDTNGFPDIYYRSGVFDLTEIVSVDSSGALGNGSSEAPAISGDGSYVVFTSDATNLVPGDTNGVWDIFVRNRSNGTTQRVSISSAGVQGNGSSASPAISADGNFVAFVSDSTNLVPGDTNGVADIFVRDRLSGTTQRMSVFSFGGTQGNGVSYSPAISADGGYVAFTSAATNLVVNDTNGFPDVFFHNRVTGATGRISISTSGAQGNGASDSPSISGNGSSVAFRSDASLISSDTNGVSDIYYRAWQSNYNEIVSVDSGGNLGNQQSGYPSISADGSYVSFRSDATNLVPGDTNARTDIFIRCRSIGTTERVSVSSNGAQVNGDSVQSSISADGRFVAFSSFATNLVAGDTNFKEDVFLRDRNASGFTSLCFPGVDGVHACPCSNPPSAPGRGCNNSASTGGAFLTASGSAYLSTDSLVFTTFAEKPSALSTVWQGPTSPAAGIVYGQGVRCVNGALKRLFNKNAVAGSITAPDFGAGDPTVSARSAAKGDVIQPGQSRFYFVSYRDPTVLGGCPASSTFNATQSGEVTWMN